MAKRYDLGSVVGKIYFNYDDSGTTKAKKGVDDTEKKVENFGKTLDTNSKKAVENLAKVGRAFAAMALSATAISGASQLVVGMATELTHLSGVAGLIPAGMLAGAAAIGTLTLGLQGFGQALSDAGDPEKFAEDLKNLSPNAQAAATAFQGMRNQLIGMRIDVQNHLFAGMSSLISTLGKQYIPVVRDGLNGMADGINKAGKEFGSFASSSGTVRDLREALMNSDSAVGKLSGSVQPLAGAFRDVGVVGSEFLPEIADAATKAATTFGNFVERARESGQLKQWIQTGLDTLKQLFAIIKNLVEIAVKFFSAFNSGGAGLFSTLEKITDQLNKFLSTAAAQKTLHDLGQTLAQISSVVVSVFLKALQEILPIINSALPPFRELVQSIGPLLIGILNVLGPLVNDLAKFWAANASWLNPLLIALASGILAFRGISLAISGVTKGVGLFKDGINAIAGVGRIIGSIGSAFGDLFVLIDKGITSAALAFGRFMVAAGQMAASIGAQAATMASEFVAAIGSMIVQIGRWIATQAMAMAESAGQMIAAAAQMVVTAAVVVAGWIAMAAEAVADAAIMAAAWLIANPWALIIAAIAAVVIYIVTHWTQIRDFFTKLWTDIRNGVVTAWNAIVDWFSNVVDRIGAFFSNAGSWLVNAGENIISGLIQGIENAWHWVEEKISDLGNSVASWFKSVIGINSPSKVFMEYGTNITQGLAIGVQQGTPQPVKATQVLAKSVIQPMPQSAGQAASAMSSGNSNSGGGGVVIQNMTFQVAGNLDPTNPVQYRQALVDIRDTLRRIDREYA